MNRWYLFLFPVIVSLTFPIKAEDVKIYSGEGLVWNKILNGFVDQDYEVIYSSSLKGFYFSDKSFFGGFIAFDLDRVRPVLDKYLEWEEVATKNQLKTRKPIPNGSWESRALWSMGDESFSGRITLEFVFFSQSPSWHQLIMSSSTAKASSNKFLTYSLDSVYLNRDKVEELANAISEEAVKEKMQDFETRKNRSDELLK